MPSHKWLNWAPSGCEIIQSGQEGTDRTDNDPVPSVLSVQRKPEQKNSGTSVAKSGDQRQSQVDQLRDPSVTEALHKVAGLLAAAYQRFVGVPRVPVNPANNLPQDGLALSAGQSVHECDRIS